MENEILKQVLQEIKGIKSDITNLQTHVDLSLADMDRRTSDSFATMDKKMDDKFEIIDSRFTEMNNRFTDMDNRFTQIDNRFTDMDKKIDDGFASMDKRLDNLSKEISSVLANDLVQTISNQLHDIQTELSIIKSSVGEHEMDIKYLKKVK